MRARIRELAANLALGCAALLVTLGLLELIVFRLILKPDDVLPNVTINGVVRYQPDTRAIFRHPDGRQTTITINRHGWNASRPFYQPEPTPGTLRIAVVGDSYVHGAFVETSDAFPEVLERELLRDGIRAEVLRFGMDGAPLSQYLHMLRREVRSYRPHIVIVPLIHNDFDESYRLLKTRYASSFMKLGLDAAGRPVEIAPGEFKPGFADRMRGSATFRYLYYKTNAYLTFKRLISRFYWGGNEAWDTEFVTSAVDVRNIRDHDKNRFFARYVLTEMQRLAVADGFKLAFVMDGVREAVYAGRSAADYEVGRLNEIARELTGELDLPFLDLQETFERDWAQNRQRLEYPYDWHWNVRGNRLIARAMADLLEADPRLLGARLKAEAAPGLRPGG